VPRIARVESFFAATSATIVHGGSLAFYSPSTDTVHLPCIDFFGDTESYYATRAHETIHWTRHETRASIAISGASASATKAMRWKSWSPNLAPPSCRPTSKLTPEVSEDHSSYIAATGSRSARRQARDL
jgi:antirestriction protein ArdC